MERIFEMAVGPRVGGGGGATQSLHQLTPDVTTKTRDF